MRTNGSVLLNADGQQEKSPPPFLSVSLLKVVAEKFVAQVDNQYPFEISPSPTFTQMDPYKPQYKVPRSISEEELIR